MVGVSTQSDDIFADLDASQREAALVTQGPVRIIAGAGAGKTRTITHRIAYACKLGQWNPDKTVAVTFSVKAADEMQLRLQQLGASSTITTSTFHSLALKQLRGIWHELCDTAFPRLVEKPGALTFRAMKRVLRTVDIEDSQVRDVMAEIAWMKVSLIDPSDYSRVCAAIHREPPANIDPDRMSQIMTMFEEEKTARNQIDFNDMLLIDCHVLQTPGELASSIRSTIGHLTVDEYQDLSPLQHRLLQLWLGENKNICVVGDPAQTVYSFAGATSYYLKNFDQEFGPLTADLTLNTDYRSTPQIIRYANKLLQGSQEREDYIKLDAVKQAGKRVETTAYADDIAEARGVARRIAKLVQHGVAMKDCAVLTRVNAQQAVICKALHEEGIRYRVRTESGWHNASLASSTEARKALMESLEQHEDQGVATVSTIHAAKGLEFSHVWIVGCSEGLIPFSSPQVGEALEEERRLFYVGVTRAEDSLHLSFSQGSASSSMATRQASRFLLRG
ncbi:MAG: ATP-dependent helicase [Bifidobacterium sp.]|jgi:DNA helicase-2/ATP-dependent DNA helicase PcrA|nr:ATP-dependent helicase [Bifidobacterium sp.]MCH4175671.1 ATP-dependent helicase [Bifidobacterium sp.]